MPIGTGLKDYKLLHAPPPNIHILIQLHLYINLLQAILSSVILAGQANGDCTVM